MATQARDLLGIKTVSLEQKARNLLGNASLNDNVVHTATFLHWCDYYSTFDFPLTDKQHHWPVTLLEQIFGSSRATSVGAIRNLSRWQIRVTTLLPIRLSITISTGVSCPRLRLSQSVLCEHNKKKREHKYRLEWPRYLINPQFIISYLIRGGCPGTRSLWKISILLTMILIAWSRVISSAFTIARSMESQRSILKDKR